MTLMGLEQTSVMRNQSLNIGLNTRNKKEGPLIGAFFFLNSRYFTAVSLLGATGFF